MREFVGVFFDKVGELVHEQAALRSRHFLPRTLFKSGAGGGDGFVDVGGIGFGDVGNDFAGRGVDGREGFSGSGVDPFVVDEKFVGADFNGGFYDCCCHRGPPCECAGWSNQRRVLRRG